MVASVLDGRETNIARMAGASLSAVFDYLGIGIHDRLVLGDQRDIST